MITNMLILTDDNPQAENYANNCALKCCDVATAERHGPPPRHDTTEDDDDTQRSILV